MGASNPYKKYESTVKNDDKWKTFLKTFNLTIPKGKKFFQEYRKIDKKAKGEINFEMFAKAYKIPKDDHAIMKRFFMSLKQDRINGEDVYFQEWACMIYDFATAGMDGIQEWIFNLYDPENTGYITYDVYKDMCRECMGESYVTKGTPQFAVAHELFRDFAKANKKKFTKLEFRKGERQEGAALLYAAILEFQEVMQKRILGKKGWKEALKVRGTVGLGSPPWLMYNKGGEYVRPLKGEKGKKKTKKVAPDEGAREDD